MRFNQVMQRLTLSLTALALVAASCSDATAPSLAGVRYALETIGGESLPVTSIVGSDVVMLADTIVFLETSESAGRLQHHQSAELRNPEPATVHSVFEESFTRAGDRLGFLAPTCGPAANCVFIPHHAQFDGDELVVTYESDIVKGRRYRRL